MEFHWIKPYLFSFIHVYSVILWLFSCYQSRILSLWQRPSGSQSRKYVLLGPLEKIFADAWSLRWGKCHQFGSARVASPLSLLQKDLYNCHRYILKINLYTNEEGKKIIFTHKWLMTSFWNNPPLNQFLQGSLDIFVSLSVECGVQHGGDYTRKDLHWSDQHLTQRRLGIDKSTGPEEQSDHREVGDTGRRCLVPPLSRVDLYPLQWRCACRGNRSWARGQCWWGLPSQWWVCYYRPIWQQERCRRRNNLSH